MITDKIPESLRIWRKPHATHPADQPLLKLKGISVRYGSTLALEDISFKIEGGQQIAVIGPNGAGKSTLFKVIAGVMNPNGGKVHVYGSEPSGHMCIAYVPQRTQVDWNFPATVADVVMMGRVTKSGPLRRHNKRDHQVVAESLEIVNLAQMARRQINALSGGQQQRVFIARALAQEAELILLDEPMNGLDSNAQSDLFRLLDQLKTKRIAVMVSLHDMKIARERFESVMLLNQRLLGFGPPEDVFNSRSLAEAYSSHLHLIADDKGGLAVSDMCCNEEDPGDD